jgi:hypothetical protein
VSQDTTQSTAALALQKKVARVQGGMAHGEDAEIGVAIAIDVAQEH